MKGKEAGTRNLGRRNATQGIDTETTHTHKQAASAPLANKH